MTTRSDHHSDYEAGQLALLSMAAIVLLVFAWTYVQVVAHGNQAKQGDDNKQRNNSALDICIHWKTARPAS